MTQPIQVPWLVRSWVLAVILTLGAVLIVWGIVEYAWLGVAETTLGIFGFLGTREAFRRQDH
jgi:hypothetical protein